MADADLTGDQRSFLNSVLDYRVSKGVWPAFLTIERALRHDMNVRKVASNLKAKYGETIAPHNAEEPVRLPLTAIAECGRAEEYYRLMPRVIRIIEDVFFGEETKPVLTSDLLKEKGWTEGDIRDIGTLLREESIFSNGASYDNAKNWWRIDLNDAIYDFRKVSTAREYVEARIRDIEERNRQHSEYSRRWPTRDSLLSARRSGLFPPLAGGGGGRVFIVHGHDEALKHEVARAVEQLELEPIVLHEAADRGRTIIEKFEVNSDVDFAVVLLTPDDDFMDARSQARMKRARQNVILELGFFLARLGRERVFILRKEDPLLEMPSDFQGVVYTPADASGGWKLRLVKNLREVGFEADANKLS